MQLQNGQFIVTIPRKLARALRYKKGDKVEFVINRRGNLEIERKANLD